MKVRDVMTTRLVTVEPSTPVHAVASLMLTRRISGVPVVDAERRVLGVVSEGDLMRREESGTAGGSRSWWLRLFGSEERGARDYIKSHGATAADVMTRDVITIRPDDDIAEVARLLERKHIKRAPVLEDGRLVGIVSRADLLRGLATHGPLARPAPRDDRAIREALMAHLKTQPWASSALVNVTVQDGVIHLWGVYDSREQHEALLLAARNTEGAKGVEDHMSLSPVIS